MVEGGETGSNLGTQRLTAQSRAGLCELCLARGQPKAMDCGGKRGGIEKLEKDREHREVPGTWGLSYSDSTFSSDYSTSLAALCNS